MSGELHNAFGRKRIAARQIDELIGLARGLAADGVINLAEVDYLRSWLAANAAITDHPVLTGLYDRVAETLEDDELGPEEAAELVVALNALSGAGFELGEVGKSCELPFCSPMPAILFQDRQFSFTGTFNYGSRKDCELSVVERGGRCGNVTRRTNVLVIGHYATESWMHSSFGDKIIRACELRQGGNPICIVSEEHWATHL